jgi:hypothetical protein
MLPPTTPGLSHLLARIPSGLAPWTNARALPLWAAVISAIPSAVLAGRPLVTEDAGVLAPGHCEIESFIAREHTADGRSPSRQAGVCCGVGATWQLNAAAASEAAGSQNTRQAAWSGKLALGTGAEDQAAWVLAWCQAFSRTRPGASRWQREATAVDLVASVPRDGATWHFNLGHQRQHQGATRSTLWAVAYEGSTWPLSGLGITPMAEVFGNDRGQAFWQGALRLTVVPERWLLDASWDRSWRGEATRLFTLGTKIAF